MGRLRTIALVLGPALVARVCAASGPGVEIARAFESVPVEGIEVSIRCGPGPEAVPAVCYVNEPTYGVLVSATAIDYEVCQIEPDATTERCGEPVHASAGEPSEVGVLLTIGPHNVIWRSVPKAPRSAPRSTRWKSRRASSMPEAPRPPSATASAGLCRAPSSPGINRTGNPVAGSTRGRRVGSPSASSSTSSTADRTWAGFPFADLVWKPILGPSALGSFGGRRDGHRIRFANGVGDWLAYAP